MTPCRLQPHRIGFDEVVDDDRRVLRRRPGGLDQPAAERAEFALSPQGRGGDRRYSREACPATCAVPQKRGANRGRHPLLFPRLLRWREGDLRPDLHQASGANAFSISSSKTPRNRQSGKVGSTVTATAPSSISRRSIIPMPTRPTGRPNALLQGSTIASIRVKASSRRPAGPSPVTVETPVPLLVTTPPPPRRADRASPGFSAATMAPCGRRASAAPSGRPSRSPQEWRRRRSRGAVHS